MMKLVQKILSHGLLIAFLVAGFFVYMNRVEIFPQWFGAKASSAAQKDTGRTKVKPPVAQSAQPAPAPAFAATDSIGDRNMGAPAGDVTQARAAQPPPVAKTPAADMPAAQAAKQASQQPAAAPAEVADGTGAAAAPDLVTQTDAAAESVGETVPVEPVDQAGFRPLDPEQTAPAAVATDQPADSGAVEVAATPPAQPATLPAPPATAPAATAVVTEPANPPVEAGAAPAGQASTGTPGTPAAQDDGLAAVAAPTTPPAVKESIAAAAPGAAEPADNAVDGATQQLQGELEQARQLYWKRDMRAAATAYRSLGEANPENPDVWGEIGNFYYSLRQRQPAVEAYSRAVTLLVGQNDQTRAQQMLGVLYKLDAGRARELEQGLLQPGH